MDRRSLLTGVGSSLALLAGCISNRESGGQPDTSTETTTASETTTETPTSTQTEATTETETTVIETAPVETAAEHVDAAQSALREALKTYAAFEGSVNTTFLSVNAATLSFAPGDVQADLDLVRTELARARKLDDGEYGSTITDLQNVVRSIERMAKVQPHLIEAHTELASAIDSTLDRNYSTARSNRRASHRALSSTETNMRVLRTIDPKITESADALPSEMFEKKLKQFETEIETFQEVIGLLPSVIAGTKSFMKAAGDLDASVDDLENALKMDSVQEKVDGISPPGYFRGKINDLSCFCGAISNASIHYKKMMEADEEYEKDREFQKTKDALRGCAHTRDILSE